MVSQISKWFKRRFKELDLLEQYFPLLFTRWQAALWGGSVLAVAFGWRFITSDWPYPVKLTACIVALFFAGYYVWRADHVRLIPKLRIVGTRFQDTPVTLGGSVFDHRTFCSTHTGMPNRVPCLRMRGLFAKNRKESRTESLGRNRYRQEFNP